MMMKMKRVKESWSKMRKKRRKLKLKIMMPGNSGVNTTVEDAKNSVQFARNSLLADCVMMKCIIRMRWIQRKTINFLEKRSNS